MKVYNDLGSNLIYNINTVKHSHTANTVPEVGNEPISKVCSLNLKSKTLQNPQRIKPTDMAKNKIPKLYHSECRTATHFRPKMSV